MLVWHLINELQKHNPELPVETEGCDCLGDTASVMEMDNIVVICRSEGVVMKSVAPQRDGYDNSDKPLPIADELGEIINPKPGEVE